VHNKKREEGSETIRHRENVYMLLGVIWIDIQSKLLLFLSVSHPRHMFSLSLFCVQECLCLRKAEAMNEVAEKERRKLCCLSFLSSPFAYRIVQRCAVARVALPYATHLQSLSLAVSLQFRLSRREKSRLINNTNVLHMCTQ
jgi:hypothetical protein